jgi:hypothetical protein
MLAIEPIAFAAAAGFAVVIVATILVIVGVRQEERRETFASPRPPTIPALLARRVLGAYAHQLPEGRHREDQEPDSASRPTRA